jgi:CDP-diacylglycerol--glycerol-3-phosphate 3-phosphatidyltransferase
MAARASFRPFPDRERPVDLGLYTLKQPAQRLLAGALPRFERANPNHLSLAILPVGAAIAACLWAGARGRPWAYLLVVALGFLRMFFATIDGMVAERFGHRTREGEILNRLAPELSDAAYTLTLALARPEWLLPGALALAAGWLVSFTGLVGATAGLPTQSVGPVGQTDRLALLQLLCVLAWAAAVFGWPVDFLGGFLWWIAIGGVLTVGLRLARHLEAARRTP